MHRTTLLCLLLLTALPSLAAEDGRYVGSLRLPDGQTVLVAEGEREARSLGSFSVRLYAAAGPGEETTFFSDGLILPRDGTLEALQLADVCAGAEPEIIVSIRSAGSGSYLSAYALDYRRTPLEPCARVAGLARDADVPAALRAAATQQPGSD